MKIKLTKKYRNHIIFILFIFMLLPSLGIIMKPFTSFKKRITIKSVKRRLRNKQLFFLNTSFTDENNTRYRYNDSFIFGSFSFKLKELEKIKKGNSVFIKGYTTYFLGFPMYNVYNVE